MAKIRAKPCKETSVIAVAIKSEWWFSAIISSAIIALAFLVLPAIALKDMYVRIVVGTFKPVLIIFGGFFALIAVFNFFKQKKLFFSARNVSTTFHSALHAQKVGMSFGNDSPIIHESLKTNTQWGNLGSQNKPGDADKTKQPTTWSIELLQRIEWKLFEDLSTAYYKEKRIRAELTKLGADGGIDIKLFQNDSEKPTSIVQCKAWNSRQVGVKEIREFLGVMSHEKISKGFFMTSGTYTTDAQEIAKANQITLINGVMLLAMIERLPTDAQQRLLNLATDGDYTTPSCSACGVKMLKRSGKRGNFWGCINFPRCRQMLHIKSG